MIQFNKKDVLKIIKVKSENKPVLPFGDDRKGGVRESKARLLRDIRLKVKVRPQDHRQELDEETEGGHCR